MRSVKVAIITQLWWISYAAAYGDITFEWAIVGNPGNGANSTVFGPLGAVEYVYQISKYEVTNFQYTDFLNVVDASGTNHLGLFNPLMSSDTSGGITFNSSAVAGMKYQVKPGRKNNPVTRVSFFDAMRFVNWLHNGQGDGSTESGAYTIVDGFTEIRSPTAKYFIPSNDEWFKAAYHKNDCVTNNYWTYPTSTDQIPFSDQPPGSDAPVISNTANFDRNDGINNGYNDGYAVTGSTINELTQNYLTNIGSYIASLSPYGTFDQGGNVWELTEGEVGARRGLRGGSWKSSDALLSKSGRSHHDSMLENIDVGFRIASIPEPPSFFLLFISLLVISTQRRRLTKSSIMPA